MVEITLTNEEADAIHALRGNAEWAALTEPQKSAAIVNAIDVVQFVYGPFKSTVETDNERLKIGTALLALELHKNPVKMNGEQLIKTKKIKSGEKQIETTYQDADKAPAVDPYPLVTAILAPLRVAASTGASISFGKLVI